MLNTFVSKLDYVVLTGFYAVRWHGRYTCQSDVGFLDLHMCFLLLCLGTHLDIDLNKNYSKYVKAHLQNYLISEVMVHSPINRILNIIDLKQKLRTSVNNTRVTYVLTVFKASFLGKRNNFKSWLKGRYFVGIRGTNNLACCCLLVAILRVINVPKHDHQL